MGPTTRDWLLVAVCALLQFVSVGTGSDHDAELANGIVETMVGLGAAFALLGRRRAPILVLSAVTAGYVVQTFLAGPTLPAAQIAATYTAARHGQSGQRGALAAGAAVALASVPAVAIAASSDRESGLVAWYVVLLLLGLLAGVMGAARVARRSSLTREAAAEERARIARDLHDIVGHGIGAIAVQAGAGRLALDADRPVEARKALVTIEQAGRDVLREVRWLVGLLRERPDGAGLADLPDLAESARRAGLAVDVSIAGDQTTVSPATGEAAYRIAQEALTNVIRHSVAHQVTIRLDLASMLVLEIADDGSGGAGVEGHGIPGMRERADSIGGRLSTGPRGDQPGWVVSAALPLGKRAR